MTAVEGHVKNWALYLELKLRVLSLNLHEEGQNEAGIICFVFTEA